MSSQHQRLYEGQSYSSFGAVGPADEQFHGDSPRGQSSGHSLPLPARNGISYIASLPASQDVCFHTGLGVSTSAVASPFDSASASPSSAASSLAFAPITTNFYQNSLSGSVTFPATAPPAYTTVGSYSHYAMSDLRPRIPSLHSTTSGMPPPSRSPGIVNPVSPSLAASARDNYTTSTPHLTRHTLPARGSSELFSRSPHSPLPSTPRSAESGAIALSPSSSTTIGGQTGSLQLDPATQLALGAGTAGPPLEATYVLHRITSADGHNVQPDIHARIDKGFFLADQDWTCYRRNYFSVACSYSLKPSISPAQLFLKRSNSTVAENIVAFAMSISAVVDGPGGKAIELVQHTPKRDKGPQGKPDRVRLSPQSSGSLGVFAGMSGASNTHLVGSQVPGQQDYDQPYSHQSQQQQIIANFDRIQFKSATANNGKRRAAQQYYHLIVELYADVGGHPSSGDARLVKIATRISAPMVVRGRSPGHYQDDRRASSSSAGPGGAGGGDNGGSSIPPSGPSANSRNLGDNMSNPLPVIGSSNSMLGSSGYQASNGLSSHHHSPANSSVNGHSVSSASSSAGHLDTPIDPILTPEEASAIEEYPQYQYFPSPIYDSQLNHSRSAHPLHNPQMPSYRDERNSGPPYTAYDGDIRAYSTGEVRRPLKEEGYMGPSLPNIASTWQFGNPSGRTEYGRADTLRRCGRYEGAESSRGFYPDLPAL